MRFEWDEDKNVLNQRKHGIDFTDVVSMFDGPLLATPDSLTEYGEERWIGIGWLFDLIAVVVYTERDGDTIRIISARKATKHEVRRYEQTIKN
ncbi:BrnT family toxin [Saccharospirillum salsuginis]|uniref:Uncharacterized protein n=1 Tax=Saccharospirillum salsuginis TaxID=418750 RepID=A0A918KDQ0_9GAMM|nr:BrnT family toxin [Saccharospirillum salsuginis]GGX58688.1 hypothetical protein GCM10007392_28280 [Saccharospirillum salsuginis]